MEEQLQITKSSAVPTKTPGANPYVLLVTFLLIVLKKLISESFPKNILPP